MGTYCWFAAMMLSSQGLFAQYAINNLPQLPDYQSQRSSSFDLMGGNHDYSSLKSGEMVRLTLSNDGKTAENIMARTMNGRAPRGAARNGG